MEHPSTEKEIDGDQTLRVVDLAAVIRIGDVIISRNPREHAIAEILSAVENKSCTVFGFANAHTVNLARVDLKFRAALSNIVLFNDGIGVSIASWILSGQGFEENCNGTDLTSRLLSALTRPTKVFLFGARPGIAEKARDKIHEQFPMAQIVGCHHGYIDQGQYEVIRDLIKQSGAELVLVALGQPTQEFWSISQGLQSGAVPVAIGAYLDFISGTITRAPVFVRRIKMEWLWRLLLEPRRLAKRYIYGNVAFLVYIAAQKMGYASIAKAKD